MIRTFTKRGPVQSDRAAVVSAGKSPGFEPGLPSRGYSPSLGPGRSRTVRTSMSWAARPLTSAISIRGTTVALVNSRRSHTRTTTVPHMDTARHARADRETIAMLSGAVKRLAYPLYKQDPAYNQNAAIAELHAITRDSQPQLVPHLLAHATTSSRAFLYQSIRNLLLAAGANETDLDQITTWIDQHSPMPY